MGKIKGVLCKVNEKAKVVEIDNTLEELQKIVHGYIECVFLGKNIVAVINEEGKLNGSLPSRKLPNDTLFDDFIVLGCTQKGEFRSFNELELDAVLKYFETPIDTQKLSAKELEEMRKIKWGIMTW